MDIQKSTSQRNQPALPDEWIERIFQRMENFYLNLWTDRFNGIPRERVKRAWADELGGFTAPEIKAGLERCRSMKFPPSLPEFLLACRPQANPQTEWLEAIDQMRIRLQGTGMDKWSRPAVYWAAVAIGWHDLNEAPWDRIKTRWQAAIENARHDVIPEYRLALPEPGQATTTREAAACKIRAISEMLAAKKKTA